MYVESAASLSSWVLVDEPGVPTDVKMRWQAIAAEQDSAIQKEKEREIEGELFRQADALRRLQAERDILTDVSAPKRSTAVALSSLDAEQRQALAIAFAKEDESSIRLRQRQTEEEHMTREALQGLRPEQKIRVPTQCGCLGASANIHKPSCQLHVA